MTSDEQVVLAQFLVAAFAHSGLEVVRHKQAAGRSYFEVVDPVSVVGALSRAGYTLRRVDPAVSVPMRPRLVRE